jgi:arginase
MEPDNLSFYEPTEQNDPVALVSIPLELGSDERGLGATPEYLFAHGLENMLTRIGRTISSSVTIPCPKPKLVASVGKAKNLREIASVARTSSAAVEKAAKRGDVVIALGGDHSAAIGSISGAALAHQSLGLIWIDAHPDAHTTETTISGNVHGMVTTSVMGFGDSRLTNVGRPGRKISPDNVVCIGLKDFDQAEIDFLRRERVKTVTMLEIAEHGLSHAILAIEALRRRVDKVWISMDMDSIDKTISPAVGMPTYNGLTRREVLTLAHRIGKTCPVAGFDIVEIAPHKDMDGRTVELALELIARFLGAEHSWYREYMHDYQEASINVDVESDRA